MARPVTERCSGTVLRGCTIATRGQLVEFRLGEVIAVEGPMRDALDDAGAAIAWDGEIPPHSSTLAVNEFGRVPGT